MRKSLISLITICSLFVTLTIFAQNPQSQGVPSPTGPSMFGMQRIVCDSVINLDAVPVNLKTLKELQKILLTLDSLEGVMNEVVVSRDSTCSSRTFFRQRAGHAHFMLDSLCDVGYNTDVIKVVLVEICSSNAMVNLLDAQLKDIYVEWDKQRDLYNAYAYPAKILFEQVVDKKILNDSKTCRNAIVYKNGKKLFSIHHYLTGYYAE